MKEFKYSLEKSSKKYNCPKCHKKTFVRFINKETQNYLDEIYGRCDRETNCGYFEHPKGQIVSIENYSNLKYTEPSFHDFKQVIESLNKPFEDNFKIYLNSIFSDTLVEIAVKKYLVGTSQHWKGSTIFWQVDNSKKVHAGKIMLYDKQTGKRCKSKSGKSYINWFHKTNQCKEFNLNQCLFGSHLLTELDNNLVVGIVESEKTAIIMSIIKTNIIWLATGSKNGFKKEILKPIKSYKIIAFPDKGEFNFWNNTANLLNNEGYNIVVNNWLEKEELFLGSDLADAFTNKKSV